MPNRTDKVASVIRHAVQNVITRGLNDPRVRGLVSVTRVDVAPDLADAQVHVSVLPAHFAQLTLRGLDDAAGFIQRQIGPAVTARRLPRLHFRLDETLKQQAALDSALAADVGRSAHAASKSSSLAMNESEDCRT
jgi:ribosome-binding factor A